VFLHELATDAGDDPQRIDAVLVNYL